MAPNNRPIHNYAPESLPENPNSSINGRDQNPAGDQKLALPAPNECNTVMNSKLRRSSRNRRPPTRFVDYVTNIP